MHQFTINIFYTLLNLTHLKKKKKLKDTFLKLNMHVTINMNLTTNLKHMKIIRVNYIDTPNVW